MILSSCPSMKNWKQKNQNIKKTKEEIEDPKELKGEKYEKPKDPNEVTMRYELKLKDGIVEVKDALPISNIEDEATSEGTQQPNNQTQTQSKNNYIKLTKFVEDFATQSLEELNSKIVMKAFHLKGMKKLYSRLGQLNHSSTMRDKNFDTWRLVLPSTYVWTKYPLVDITAIDSIRIGNAILELMQLMEFVGGRIVLALEGGYNLGSLVDSFLACVKVLLKDTPSSISLVVYPFESTWCVIQAIRKALQVYA
eukprot:Gb_17696 [translate_table: standard]